MDTRLCYNGTDRMYEVRLGLRVLSSHPTKEQAELALLNGEAPKALELAQTLITAHPELAERGDQGRGSGGSGRCPGERPARPLRRFARSRRARRRVYDVDVEARPAPALTGSIVRPIVNGRRLCKHVLAALHRAQAGAPRPSTSRPNGDDVHDRP